MLLEKLAMNAGRDEAFSNPQGPSEEASLHFFLDFPGPECQNITMSAYGLDQNLIDRIVQIINSRHQTEKIVLFGSRANGHYKKTSDIDLALFAPGLTGSTLNAIRHDLDEQVPTPLKFDVLDFFQIHKESLKNTILQEGTVIYESQKD